MWWEQGPLIQLRLQLYTKRSMNQVQKCFAELGGRGLPWRGLSIDYVMRPGAFDPAKASVVHKEVNESSMQKVWLRLEQGGGLMGWGFSPRGHWPRKRVWECVTLKTPFSHLSHSSQGSHFKFKQKSLKVSSQDPFLRKIWKFYPLQSQFLPKF